MKHNAILLLICLAAMLFIISITSCTVAKPLKVKVEHIEKVDTGVEVWVKYHNPHYKYRSFHLVKVFNSLPGDIKRGNVLILHPNKDTSGFKIVYAR